MKRMERRWVINEVKKYKVAIIFLVFNLVFYGVFVIHHYAADTYLTEALVWHETVMQYFMNARWLMSGFAYICEIFDIGYDTQQLMSWGISIVSITLASTIVYHLLLEKCKRCADTARGIWGILASFMLVSNVFMLEYFIFAEYTGMICLGILFDVIAAVFILKCIESQKVYQYFMGIAFAILGINGHQGSFAIFVIICVLFSRDMFANVKIFLKNNLIIGSAYLIPCFINIWETRVGGTSRATRNIDIAASFEKSTGDLINLFKSTANFMPYGTYALFVGILGIYFLYFIIRNRSWKVFIISAYCCIIAILGIYAPLLMTDINAIDVVPRTVYIMGGAIPIILILMLMNLEISPYKNILLSVIVILFLVMQYHGLLKIITGTYQANAVDRYESQYITSYLRDYEEKTGIKVTKMALYWDKNVSGYATGVTGYGAVNERVMSNDWAAPLAIQCLDGYKIESTEKSDEVYKEFFEGKDWTQINDEQFVVIGDTLHFCAY
ncbi:hypothetical protein GCM10008910_10970 [Faecalicatena orotica]|nr:glucosyltransferase domain-containing protein [Faecalicatena orotica]